MVCFVLLWRKSNEENGRNGYFCTRTMTPVRETPYEAALVLGGSYRTDATP
jgi:hypothetical protein